MASFARATPFYDYAARGDVEPDNRAKINLYSHALASWAEPDYLEDKAVLYVRRGNALEALKEWEAALADFEKALKINPKDWTVYKGRADVFAGLKRCAESLADDRKALELSDAAHRGSLHMDMGYTQRDCARDLPAAELEFRAAVADGLKAEDTDIMSRSAIALGGVTCLQHQYEKGIGLLRSAVATNPRHVTALYELGICQQASGDLKGALASFTRAIDVVAPQRPPGDEPREVSRKTVAGAQITSSTDGAEKLSDCYYRRAQIERKNGVGRAAAADFREACRLGKKAACRAPAREGGSP